jgi:hypothetical protein
MALPHRGGTILTLGIVSLAFNVLSAIGGMAFAPCCLTGVVPVATAIPAWVMANRDLRLMQMGQMDAAGLSSTSAGRVCGIISLALSAITVLATVVMMILGVALFAGMAAGAAGGAGGAP